MNTEGFAVRGWLHGLVEGSCSIDEAEEVINKFINVAYQKGKVQAGLDVLLRVNNKKCSEKYEDAFPRACNIIRDRIHRKRKNSGLNGK